MAASPSMPRPLTHKETADLMQKPGFLGACRLASRADPILQGRETVIERMHRSSDSISRDHDNDAGRLKSRHIYL